MKTFEVTVTVPTVQVWKYIVNAKSEEEAKEMVDNNDVEVADYYLDSDVEEMEVNVVEI